MSDFNTFLDRCLDGLPRDKYRKRAKAELEDHLLTLCEELEAAGASPEEAQAKAVELMGVPADLNESFRAEWIRRAERFSYCAPILARGILLSILVGTLFIWLVLIPSSLIFSWAFTADHLYAIFFAIHLIPVYLVGAKELDRAFTLHPHKLRIVIFGLLVVWVAEVLAVYTGYVLFSQASDFLFLENPLFSIAYVLVLYGSYILFPASCAMVTSRLSSFYMLLSFAICIAVIARYVFTKRTQTPSQIER